MEIVSAKIEKNDKILADKILKDIGLNMNTYITMAIKQLINKKCIPFEIITAEKFEEDYLLKYFSKNELEKGAKELAYIEKHLDKYKNYNNINELLNSIKN